VAELSVQSSNGARERIPLTSDKITIGRSRQSDVSLPDQWLSRRHAEIHRRDDGFYLVDLGSKNGTLLNGAKISRECLLQPGDRIVLGEYVLTFSWDEPKDPDEDSGEYETFAYPARRLSDIDTRSSLDPETLARQSRVLGILTRAASSLLTHWSLADLFKYVLDQVFEAIPAQRGAILLLEGDPPKLVLKACRSCEGALGQPNVSRSIARRVLEQRVSLLIPRVWEDAELRSKESILNLGIRSAICAPLWLTAESDEADQVIGIVYLDSLEESRTFNEEDLRILTALANLAASRIETARLLEATLEKRSLEQDLRMAAEIQLGLLPRHSPEIDGYGVVGTSAPCRAVGGDYYDFLVEGGMLHFALADVSGKGTGAALLTTALRAAVRSHWTEPSITRAIARINRTVCQNVPENRYITFFLGRLDPASGHLLYVNAGQNPPLLVRAGGEVERLEDGGTVLGMFEAAPYSEGAAELRPGDTLLVFSDGISETWSAAGEEFGEQRLLEAALERRDLDAQALKQEIFRRLDAFSGGAKATDDRTMVILKRL
jgi:serine phosphatase RsbU (regulator of sigma subunit)